MATESELYVLLRLRWLSRMFTSVIGVALGEKCQTQNLLAKAPFHMERSGVSTVYICLCGLSFL